MTVAQLNSQRRTSENGDSVAEQTKTEETDTDTDTEETGTEETETKETETKETETAKLSEMRRKFGDEDDISEEESYSPWTKRIKKSSFKFEDGVAVSVEALETLFTEEGKGRKVKRFVMAGGVRKEVFTYDQLYQPTHLKFGDGDAVPEEALKTLFEEEGKGRKVKRFVMVGGVRKEVFTIKALSYFFSYPDGTKVPLKDRETWHARKRKSPYIQIVQGNVFSNIALAKDNKTLLFSYIKPYSLSLMQLFTFLNGLYRSPLKMRS